MLEPSVGFEADGLDVLTTHFDDGLRRRHGVEMARLRERIRWEAPVGFEVDEKMRETIMSAAAVLAAGLDVAESPFLNVRSVIVHPRPIRITERIPRVSGGLMRSGGRLLAGQSGHGHGPVALSWQQIQADLRRPSLGRNLVLHEFAHKFDQLDGAADGLPPMIDRRLRSEFTEVMTRSMNRVRRRRQRLLRPYAGSDPAEHFAVATEVFFTRPNEMRRRSFPLYRVLSEVYRQDPAWSPQTETS